MINIKDAQQQYKVFYDELSLEEYWKLYIWFRLSLFDLKYIQALFTFVNVATVNHSLLKFEYFIRTNSISKSNAVKFGNAAYKYIKIVCVFFFSNEGQYSTAMKSC